MVYSQNRKCIYLSSSQADFYPEGQDEHGIVEFTLSEDIVSDGPKAVWVRVVSACIPNSVYNVPRGKNTLVVGANTYTLGVRNYSATELVAALNAALVPENLTVSHDEDAARLTFTKGTPGAATLKATSGLAEAIGLAGADVVVPGSGSAVMPRVIDLAGVRSLLICSPNLQTHSLDSAEGSSIKYVLAAVPMTAGFGSLQAYTAPSTELMHTSTRHVKNLRLELYDENFQRVYLSGARWNVVIEVDVV